MIAAMSSTSTGHPSGGPPWARLAADARACAPGASPPSMAATPAALAGAAAAPDGRAAALAEIACFESHRAGLAARGGGRRAFRSHPRGRRGPRPDRRRVDAIVSAANGFDILKLNAHPRGLFVHVPCRSPPRGRPHAAQGRAGQQRLQRIPDLAGLRGAGARDPSGATVQALDLALCNPATGVAIGQVYTVLTIQQRYADFRFLDEGARKSDIQAPSRMRRRRRPLEAVVREGGSGSGGRGIVPTLQPLLNRWRVRRRSGSSFAGSPSVA